jgi:hypothetical protein
MSDKNFKVKNGIDSTGPVTITTPNTSTTGLIINVPAGGKSISFLRDGIERASIDDWGSFTTNSINVVQPWWVRSPGIDTQSFFWVGAGSRSSVGIAGTNSGTNPVVYISQNGTATNDLTQWIKPDNTILAKIDYLGNITANDLTLAGNLTVNGTTTNLNSTNLVIEDKNIILADVATPTDTTADGAGITIKGATDKTFNWVNSTKSFTTSDPLIINNTSTTTVPLIAKGYASQTANHFEVQDSAGNKMFVVSPPAGTLQPLEYFFVRPGGTGGTATIGTNSYSFRVVASGGSSVSLGTPGGGTSLQVVASDTFNRYKIIGSGTGIAPTFTTDGNDADVNMYITAKGAGKIGINKTSPTGYVHAVSSSSSTVGLIVEGASGQTSTNIFEVQRAGGGDASFGVSHNYIDLNRNTTAAASMTIYGPNAGAVPLYVKGRSSQTGDLTNWLDSNSNILSSIKSNGSFYVTGNSNTTWISGPSTSGTNQIVSNGNDLAFSPFFDGLFAPANSSGRWRPVNDATSDLGTSGQRWKDLYATASVLTNNSASKVGLIVKGAASQTASLQEWQNSSGTILASIVDTGFSTAILRIPYIYTYTVQGWNAVGGSIEFANATPITIKPQSASVVNLVIKGAASQTANLQEWQNSSGTALGWFNAYGSMQITNSFNGARAELGNTGVAQASTLVLKIQGVSGQTANLTEWQNNSGTVLAKIDKDGIITVPAINVVGQSISSNTTMIAGYRYFVDTSASRTLTLPSSATIGDEIQIFDSTNTAGTNNITINSNNGKIEGVVESYIIDVNGAAIVMTYTGSTYGWKVRM